jgi:hypothetical protein
MRRVAIDLRVRWMRAAMVWRYACSRRRLLVGCHIGALRYNARRVKYALHRGRDS